SIALAYKSDEDRDNCSSSVSSDSSHFPNDEETTSHFAKSDEIDSSCNEKRTASSVKSTDLIETTVLNEDVAVLTESLTMHINKTDTTRKASTTEKVGAKPNAPFLINNECRLIMTLLTAKDESTRNCLLRKAAVDRHIFLKNGDKDVLNNRLVRIKNVFSPASSKIVKFIDDNTPKRRKDKATFEGEVNTLVRRYISEADTYKYILQEMVLNNGRYDFSSEVNKVAIESFVKSLIQANLGRIVEGDIRVNEYDNTEAYMTNEDDDRDIYFSSTLIRQCAFHGTRVKAFAFTEDDRTPMKEVVKRIVRGFVVEILDDQSRKQIVGKFDLNRTNSSTIVIVPDDRRLPRFKIDKSSDVMLSSNAIVPQANTLYLVKLDYWKEKKPYASLIEEIGKADELETGNRAVLLKNSLNPTVFSESILSALPKEPFVIPATEYNSRENLTKECIFTIDPSTAKDLDDAVSCTKLESGNFEVGVHISDVSYFINENSELDNVIKDQATTIYLVNKVYHMLPRQLCDLCSLLPGQDKLTFSVFWEVTPKAEIVSTRFAKTIINSCSKFAYEHAQLMIDQPDKEFEEGNLPTIHRFTSREVCEKINMLNELATILRKKRFENGCISINQKKIIFDLNDDGEPIAFRPDDRGESNFLIEEFMLLANQSVARFIFDKFPNIAVLRNHAPPKPNMMTELVAKLETLNYKMNVSSAKTVADSIAKIIRSAGNNEALIAVLNSMIAKPMVRAEYVCSGHINNAKGLRHYALSIPIYTHFTSPIRRYPDILVHRLLAAALNIAPIPTRSPSELRQITRNCNDQKYNAKLAGEDSTNLYFLHYLRLVGPIKMRAAIKELSKGTDLHIMLIDSGHNIRVNMKNNEPEVKFIIANGVPSIQFVGCGASTAIRANIFDPVLVEGCGPKNLIISKDSVLLKLSAKSSIADLSPRHNNGNKMCRDQSEPNRGPRLRSTMHAA
ncbi:DIS3-like exonuclease 2, partial [Pseudolycoriella hygida]